MDDLQARLDRAITEARADVESEFIGQNGLMEACVNWDALDHFAVLVALREWYRVAAHADCSPKVCGRRRDKDAEAERLLGEYA